MMRPKEGDTVIFTCDVNTTDVIQNYEWYHDDTEISGEKGKQYMIRRGTRIESGNYSCKVLTQSLERSSERRYLTFTCK